MKMTKLFLNHSFMNLILIFPIKFKNIRNILFVEIDYLTQFHGRTCKFSSRCSDYTLTALYPLSDLSFTFPAFLLAPFVAAPPQISPLATKSDYLEKRIPPLTRRGLGMFLSPLAGMVKELSGGRGGCSGRKVDRVTW